MGDLATIIGLVMAIISVGVAMVLKGAKLEVLVNPAAFLIIFAGTLAVLFVAFPLRQMQYFPQLLKIAFLGRSFPDRCDLIRQLVGYATMVRREGLLSLDREIDTTEDPFLKKAMILITSSSSTEDLERILEADLEAMKERHRVGASMFSQAGTYAPTLGVLGAVVGLIAALGNLNDIEKLGHSIAAAFVATLMGIFTGYVVWHPLANKMKNFSRIEVELKELALVGFCCIQRGDNAIMIEQELLAHLSESEAAHYHEQKEVPVHVEEATAS